MAEEIETAWQTSSWRALHYKCYNCITEFMGVNLLYCPYCGSTLHQRGPAPRLPRDYVTAGWNAIAFRSTKAGFVVKDIVEAGSYGGKL